MSILQDLWSNVAGKIFLITLVSYLFGYMVYGGYLYVFFDRKGNLPFSLADFSIADLITIFPTAIITLINFIPKAIIEVLKGFFIHFAIPFALAAITRFTLNLQLIAFTNNTLLIGYLGQAGIFIWSLGYLCAIFRPFKIPRFVFVLVEIAGALLVFSSIPNPSGATVSVPPPSSLPQQIFNFIFAFVFSLELLALPYVFGMGIAETTIKSKLLMKIDRLTLSQPLFPDKTKKVKTISEPLHRKTIWEQFFLSRNFTADIGPNVYEWSSLSDQDFYLIATFEKFVLLFVPDENSKNGRTIMVNRDIILSMELSKSQQCKI